MTKQPESTFSVACCSKTILQGTNFPKFEFFMSHVSKYYNFGDDMFAVKTMITTTYIAYCNTKTAKQFNGSMFCCFDAIHEYDKTKIIYVVCMRTMYNVGP